MAFKHGTFPPSPDVRIIGPKIAHSKGFWELAWANMDQIWVKIALDHLFEHPKRSTTLEKMIFDHSWTYR